METKQYTIDKKTITLSNLAKEWHLSRSLLFELMIEKNLLQVIGKAKRIANSKYGYTTQHVTRTTIYIYQNRKAELFKILEIPSLESWEKMCFRCREIKHVNEFFERMATCKVCCGKRKKSNWEISEKKHKINPKFLVRGLKYD